MYGNYKTVYWVVVWILFMSSWLVAEFKFFTSYHWNKNFISITYIFFSVIDYKILGLFWSQYYVVLWYLLIWLMFFMVTSQILGAAIKWLPHPLQWRHNGHESVWNHQPHDCLCNCQAQIRENMKALRHWPLCGEFTGDQWIPRKNGQ